MLGTALIHSSLGQAHLLQAVQEGTVDCSQAEAHLEEAVGGLRAAGQRDELPRGLLARAALRRIQGDFRRAEADLAEAAAIAGRGEMRLVHRVVANPHPSIRAPLHSALLGMLKLDIIEPTVRFTAC